MISRARADEVIRRFAGKRVLVVGDLMLDRYVTGEVERISPEAPVPVLQVRHVRVRPGGAANVALNVQCMGGHAIVAGVVGDDAEGVELQALLAAEDISAAGIVVSRNVATTVKTRIMAERQQMLRMDREDLAADPDASVPELCRRIASQIGETNGVVIEDYGKGAITERVAQACVDGAAAASIPSGLDPKDNHALPVSGITLATPNYREACLAAGVKEQRLDVGPELEAHLLGVGQRLRGKWSARLLIITLGSHGMFLLGDDGAPVVIPTRAREVFDVSGAGDTVIAVALLALAGGASEREAASLANYAAGVVVGKVGTAGCTASELLESIAE